MVDKCSRCGKPVSRRPQSAPKIVCLECRRAHPVITCYVCGKPMRNWWQSVKPQGEAAHYTCIRDYRCKVCKAELPQWPYGERPHFTQSGRPRQGTLLCEQHRHYRWCTCIVCEERYLGPNTHYCRKHRPPNPGFKRRPGPSRLKSDIPPERIVSKKVYERDNWICGICHKPINPQLKHPHLMSASVDHVIPLAQGGAHTYKNVQAAHLDCNVHKHAKLADDKQPLHVSHPKTVKNSRC